ncbi:MAG: LytTR family DNA-binding domain-containing protein [Bacteroidales bacterium]|nr:LytTR family DNA-binding domain-containing protein [Bacteroidales bacterium]
MLKAVIIDDEKKAREAIKLAVEIYCEKTEIIGEASSVQSGYDLIKSTSPDLIFLDIKMQDGSGFDLLKKFPEPEFIPIFVTAYNHYAIKAFKYSAIDYLVKPIDSDELINAVGKAEKFNEKKDIIAKIEALNTNITNKLSEPKKLVLKTEHNIYIVNVCDIIHCESDGNYTSVFVKNEKKIVVSKIIKEFEELLKQNNFLRIHQSHLINLNHLSSYDKYTSRVTMDDNIKLPVSVRKKNLLIDLLNKL